MNRPRVLSLTLASLATAWLLLWANAGFSSLLPNVLWLFIGVLVAMGAIWFAWSPSEQPLAEHETSIDHTFTEL